MSVGHICTREVDVAHAGETAWQAAERMHQRTVGALIVLDDQHQPVGVLTDRDLVIRVLAPGKDPHETTVAEVMTPDPVSISQDESISTALARMRAGAFRRVPVVDSQGALAGVLTLDDVLMLLAEEFTQIGQLLQAETPQAAANMRSRAR